MIKILTAILLSSILLVGCDETSVNTDEVNNNEAPATESASTVDEPANNDQTENDVASEGSTDDADQEEGVTVDHTSVQPVIDRINQYIQEVYDLAAENVFYMVSEEGQQMQFEFRQTVDGGEQAPLIGIFKYDSKTGRLETTNELGEQIILEENLQLN